MAIRSAKHYAQIWNDTPQPDKREALETIVRGFMDEIPMLVQMNVPDGKVGDAIKVLEQQQKKWNAMCRHAEGTQLKPALFDRLIESYDGIMYDTWKQVKKIEEVRKN